jgi:histone deacetylase HOS3
MEELKIMCDDAEAKLAMNGKELTRPDINRSSDQGPPPKLHEGDLYLCSESLNAMEGALGAVCEGVDAVFQGTASGRGPHRAFVAIRPPGHHCSADYPSGFCWLNNVHVGISHAALHHGLTHAAIIDFDLHHGDGSQSIAWDHNTRALNLPKNAVPWKKTSIGYFSLHDINSYPCEMGDEEKIKNASLCIDNAHGQSIWNVHLQPWKTETEFWELYETRYNIILEKTRNYLHYHTQRLRSLPNQVQPKGAIFLSAGFDASEWESSGMQRHKVNVPTEFYARLTRDVVKLAAEEGCSVQGRIISVLEGGYSDRALCSGILSHISGLAGGDPTVINTELDHPGLRYEMAQKAGALGAKKSDAAETALGIQPPYDATWWALPQLEAIDAIVNPPPVHETKKPRDSGPPTYSSPTQSFKAKIATPKIQRNGNGSSCSVSRAPSPPPPEVYWTTAAHELSKLLIPSDRQTMSCKPEDLSAEATRARRDRQSSLTPPTQTNGPAPSNPSSRMALRERKAKPLSTPEEEDETERPISRASRRRTVAGGAISNADKVRTVVSLMSDYRINS